jgi:predicted DNA-binding transcriptional regulator AlpA
LESARNLTAEQLPSLLGQLELIKMTAIARLTSDGSPHEQTDRLLNSREAAELFGISEAFLYRNHAHYDFTIRLGRKLLFSHLGIQRFLQRRGLLRTKRPGGASDSPVK